MTTSAWSDEETQPVASDREALRQLVGFPAHVSKTRSQAPPALNCLAALGRWRTKHGGQSTALPTRLTLGTQYCARIGQRKVRHSLRR